VLFTDVKKSEFRHDLLKQNLSCFEKKEILKSDLYKDKNGIVWHENNKEIDLNGEFFEVVKIEEHGTSVTLCILKDKKENDLFASYYLSKPDNKEPFLQVVKLFLNLQYLKTENYNLEHKTEYIKQTPHYTAVILNSEYAF